MIYLYLFLEFFKVGLFTFGGGYAMIPLIKEVVLSHGWMNEDHFLDMIGLSEVTPGPIAINMATFIGNEQGGILGATLATIGVILPAFIIMLLISILLKRFMKNRFVQSALKGIKFVAIALISSSAIILLCDLLFPYTYQNGAMSFAPNLDYIKIFLLVIAGYFLLKLTFKRKPSPIFVIIMAALIGLVYFYI